VRHDVIELREIAWQVRDFDLIGVSYYPKWSALDMKQAQTALTAVKKRFKADIIVV
jgi:arabinogalactan endo-1,4-beta-galactosidase